MTDTIRVYKLAKELGVDPKQILCLCEKNQIGPASILSSLNAQQRQMIESRIRGDNPGNEFHPALVPVWRPPPTLRHAGSPNDRTSTH
jgi:hypothetical protein